MSPGTDYYPTFLGETGRMHQISTTAGKEVFCLTYFPLRNVLNSVSKAFSQILGIECSEMTEQGKTENKRKRKGNEVLACI